MKNKLSELKKLATVALTVAMFSCKAQSPKNSENNTPKPNIIYIMADDLTINAISAYKEGIYGNIAPTPNIDRLASQGMIFKNAICTNAICGPSRAAILTGKYSHVNGFFKNENGGVFNPNQWTFPQEFQKNGYQTSLFGKWHLGSEPKGFDEFKFHAASAQQGLYWNPVYNINGKNEKVKGYATNITTDFALQWLNERNSDKPFLMLLQYKAPHRPWEPDKKYEKLWDDIEMPYPETFNDDYKTREKTAGDTEMTMEHFSRKDMKLTPPADLKGKELLKWNFYGSQNNEVVIPEGMSFEQARKWRYQTYIKDYLACVKSLDDNLGRLLDYLDQNNLADNTAIIFTSDQGFYLGEHGFFDKRFIYDESVRMPFIIKYPKWIKPGTVNKDIIANIDFAPTLLDIANIKYKEKIQGKSFKELLQGNTPKNWQQATYYHYYEFPYWHHVQPHYGIKTPEYTLAHFYYNIDVWELYDLKKDPKQLNNVYNNPEYAHVVKKLKKELFSLQKKYGDNKSLDEYRKMTDANLGLIIENGEYNVKDIITK